MAPDMLSSDKKFLATSQHGRWHHDRHTCEREKAHGGTGSKRNSEADTFSSTESNWGPSRTT